MKVALVVALVALIGLAGCGSNDTVQQANAYISAINKAQKEFTAHSAALEGKVNGESAKQDVATLTKFSGAVDTFLARVRAIRPPAKIKALHAKLTATLVRFSASLRRARADVTSKNVGRILDGQSRFVTAAHTFTKAMNATLGQINTALKR